jgi:GNAT superfamily N-acetyltransferase
MSPYAAVHQTPAPETYQHLRLQSGLSPKTDEAVALALPNTLFSVVILYAGHPIGMGRVVGDGGSFCQVVDICVLPEHQGKGIGKLIMQEIRQYLITLPSSCYVSLLADGKADSLYAQFGFQQTMPAAKGMYLKIA